MTSINNVCYSNNCSLNYSGICFEVIHTKRRKMTVQLLTVIRFVNKYMTNDKYGREHSIDMLMMNNDN